MTTDPDSAGLWAETAPPAPEAAPLDTDASADIAIVGAGYTGLAAALAAAEAGARVAVLEADEIGSGGSGRNVGLVNAGSWLMPDEFDRRLARHGADARLARLLAESPAAVWTLIERHGIDCEARPSGTLHCAPDAAGLSALDTRARQWQARGVKVELLDAEATRARSGSTVFRAALFDPRAGTIQPLSYARGLAHAARAAGARLHVKSRVIEARRDGHDWVLRTPGGRLRAPRVIWAGNAYGQGPAAEPTRALASFPYFNFATAPLPEDLRASILPGGAGAWDTAKLLTSFRLDAAGRFLIGGVGQLGSAEIATHRAWAERRMARLFPQLAGQPFTHGWWGRIGMTSDAVPRLWQPGPGAFGLLGYNGRGIGPGTVLGRCLAEAALGRSDLPPLPAPAPDPWRPARDLVFRAGSVVWHLAVKRR